MPPVDDIGRILRACRFSAPKGVERACPPERMNTQARQAMFQCPEGR